MLGHDIVRVSCYNNRSELRAQRGRTNAAANRQISEIRSPSGDQHALVRKPLPTAIDVVQPHDIVLAEIAADLDLNQFERNLAGIGKPMNASDADIN